MRLRLCFDGMRVMTRPCGDAEYRCPVCLLPQAVPSLAWPECGTCRRYKEEAR